MVAALTKRGVEEPYIGRDNESHGFRNEEHPYEFHGAREQFLAKQFKPEVQCD